MAAYERIESVAERPGLRYVTVGGIEQGAEEEEVAARFRAELERRSRREAEIGRTLAGPHRDELVFYLNDMEVRPFASQGQHRTFGMALKLAQFFYLLDRTDERPLLLLDDVFGGLDRERTAGFLDMLQAESLGQSIITDTDRARFSGAVPFEAPHNRSFRMKAGQVERDECK
jgi:DNA replication and repair protein RecF